jgi:hypothetical protein
MEEHIVPFFLPFAFPIEEDVRERKIGGRIYPPWVSGVVILRKFTGDRRGLGVRLLTCPKTQLGFVIDIGVL